MIDVVTQKDIFDKFHNLPTWTKKTNFLRSIVKREPVKENLDPRSNIKSKSFFTYCYFCDENEKIQRVCMLFVSKLLQINRSKIFRAASSLSTNPFSIDRRGSAPKNKTAASDIRFITKFIGTFPCYESKVNSKISDIKYFHPSLTLNKIYQLYLNACSLKQIKSVSKSIFTRTLTKQFSRYQTFKSLKSVCNFCHIKKKKVLSPEITDATKLDEDKHLLALKDQKNELLKWNIDPEIQRQQSLYLNCNIH